MRPLSPPTFLVESCILYIIGEYNASVGAGSWKLFYNNIGYNSQLSQDAMKCLSVLTNDNIKDLHERISKLTLSVGPHFP